MVDVRYLGFSVARMDPDAPARSDERLGRFVALPEPMPTGTILDLGGEHHRVARVEEGEHPGVWLRAVRPAAAPSPVEVETTAPSAPPAMDEAEAKGDAGDAKDDPTPDDGRRGRKRRARKTMLGR